MDNRNIQPVINIASLLFTKATVKEFIKPETIRRVRETTLNLHGYETQRARIENREQ